MTGPSVLVSHDLDGVYGSWAGANADIFVEYVDKFSMEKVDFFGIIPNDTLKRGHGYYQNVNLYLGVGVCQQNISDIHLIKHTVT